MYSAKTILSAVVFVAGLTSVNARAFYSGNPAPAQACGNGQELKCCNGAKSFATLLSTDCLEIPLVAGGGSPCGGGNKVSCCNTNNQQSGTLNLAFSCSPLDLDLLDGLLSPLSGLGGGPGGNL